MAWTVEKFPLSAIAFPELVFYNMAVASPNRSALNPVFGGRHKMFGKFVKNSCNSRMLFPNRPVAKSQNSNQKSQIPRRCPITENPQTAPQEKPPRKRGGQPGNANALKHGYYSPRFTHFIPDPGIDPFPGVHNQIALLTLYLHSLVELNAQLHTLHDRLSLLRILDLAMNRLTRLLNLSQRLPGAAEDKMAMRRVLCDVLDDLLAAAERGSPPPAGPTA